MAKYYAVQSMTDFLVWIRAAESFVYMEKCYELLLILYALCNVLSEEDRTACIHHGHNDLSLISSYHELS